MADTTPDTNPNADLVTPTRSLADIQIVDDGGSMVTQPNGVLQWFFNTQMKNVKKDICPLFYWHGVYFIKRNCPTFLDSNGGKMSLA